MMNHSRRDLWTLKPTGRLEITGVLRLTSALHVGGNFSMASDTDAGVLRHPDGRPFIPGSSMKGVLRSYLERISQPLPSIRSCGLYAPVYNQEEREDHVLPRLDDRCPTPTWIKERKDATTAKEEDFQALCHTCTLFGSPILAGKVRIPDLEVQVPPEVEIRDGVGIDRDSGTAVDGVKYDFEVVPVDTVFTFRWMVDSPDPMEQALVAVGVRELMAGRVAIGGKTSRGLGHCVLEDVRILHVAFDDARSFAQYLQGEIAPMEGSEVEAFLNQAIEKLFNPA